MFAKLVTNNAIGSAFSANVYYNTLVGVITGAITSNTQLDPVQFNQASSYLVSAVPPGWSVEFPCANIGVTSGPRSPLPGANAIMIKAPWSDSASNAKYLFLHPCFGGPATATVTQNTSIHIRATPHEGYLYTGTDLQVTNTWAQIAITQNTQAFNQVAGTSMVPFMGPFVTGNGFVTIVSCSQSHLFVATYKDINGTQFNGYYYVTEYSRDDPWNTVSNGYPSWLFDMAANNAGLYSLGTATNHTQALARVLSTETGRDVPWVSSYSGGGAFANADCNWGITARDVSFGQSRQNPGGAFGHPFLPRGLAITGLSQFFPGNYAIGRDANKNPSAQMTELRVTSVNMGANLTSNNIFAGGSINAVAPYVYAFRSQYNTFDQVVFNGNTYTHLILNTGSVGTTNASCFLIKEV